MNVPQHLIVAVFTVLSLQVGLTHAAAAPNPPANAPARKAPAAAPKLEIDRAVNHGTIIRIKKACAYTHHALDPYYDACFAPSHDRLFVWDGRQDGKLGVMYWRTSKKEGGATIRRGICIRTKGVRSPNFYQLCNKNFPEKQFLTFYAGYHRGGALTLANLKLGKRCTWRIDGGGVSEMGWCSL